MNMKEYVVNGAIGVTIPNLKVGRNYLPYISELKDRTIKYIDVCYNIYTLEHAIGALPADYALSLCKKATSELVFDNVSAVEFAPSVNNGRRQFVGYKLDLEKSFLSVDPMGAGQNAFLVFYYEDDKGEQTQANSILPTRKSTSGVQLTDGFNSYFQENRTINDKHFTGIYPTYSAFNNSGFVNLLGDYSWSCLMINLVRGSDIFFRNVPVNCLLREGYYSEGCIVFDGVQIDFTNSFLESADPSNTKGYWMSLGFDYKD